MGILGNLFNTSSSPDGTLTDDDIRRAATSRYLTALGAGMMAASAPSPYPTNFGAILGSGLQSGMEAEDSYTKNAIQQRRLQQQMRREDELWPDQKEQMQAKTRLANTQADMMGQQSKDFEYYIKEGEGGKQVRRVNKIGPEAEALLAEGWVPMEAWKATLADQRKFLPMEDPSSPSGISYRNPITGQSAGAAPGKYFYWGQDAEGAPIQYPTQGPQARAPQAPPTGSVRKDAPELPGTSVEKNVSIDALKRQVDDLESLYDPSYVGAVDSRLGGLREMTDVGATPGESTFRSLASSIANTLLQLRSGAQINEHEFKRLMQEVPDIKLGETSFNARLKRFRGELEAIQADRSKQFGQAGYRGTGQQPQQQQSIQEGKTGTEKGTGRKVIFRGGQWEYAD